jgi:U3 small nucleolar RNA-associated protein MPP10
MYAPGDEGKTNGEVLLKSGAAVAKGEMTREEKLRRRRREKERKKKSGRNGTGKVGQSGKAKEKQEVLGALKRGGVKVIGKKGDVKDVEGRKVEGGKASKSGDTLKL